jgi:hypothetical protein
VARARVRIVSGLTRSGSTTGQSDSIAHAIRMRLEDAWQAVSGMPLAFEDLDGGSDERGCGDIDLRRGMPVARPRQL